MSCNNIAFQKICRFSKKKKKDMKFQFEILTKLQFTNIYNNKFYVFYAKVTIKSKKLLIPCLCKLFSL